jgi:S-sulfosulfanyl-L-cysteine sulfohydrolase
VAGWASVSPQQGKPVADVVADYLRSEQIVKIKRVNRVTLKGVDHNPGIGEND